MSQTYRSWRTNITPEDENAEARAIEGLNFETENDRVLFQDARMGVHVTDFWNSEVGFWLRKKCGDRVTSILAELTKVPPSDVDTVTDLLVELRANQGIINLIIGAISDGKNAQEAMRQGEDSYGD